MLVDFNTGKEIKNSGTLSVTQTLNKLGITSHQNPEEVSFDEIVANNGILPPNILIQQFAAVLAIMKEGKTLTSDHIDFLIEQCEGWEVSDQFAMIEYYEGENT